MFLILEIPCCETLRDGLKDGVSSFMRSEEDKFLLILDGHCLLS